MRVAAFLVCAITAIVGENIKLNENGCPADYTQEKLIPHAHCNKYYLCIHGTLVERQCSESLLFNVKKKICDWPQNVECKNQSNEKNPERDITVDDDKKTKKGQEKYNSNPKEASTICGQPGSDGVLVAHEHCNKFYKCAHGKNVSMRCNGNLLYNPFKEWCDYPENVKCGDRIIPGPEDDDNEIDQEDNDNDGGGDNDNNGSCNCVPGEAPYICGKLGSDGVLVAHEHCNKFYKCAHGKNVSMRCYGNLLYNPFKEWCDYPDNVKCGDRIIPGPEDDDNEIDQEDNDNDGGGDNDNNGSCNCVPGEAPYICGKLGSDGVLVAHEHCNKFYKCAHGKNVSMRCYGNLLYNPFKEWCDYPDNVKCGDRIIPGPEDDDNEIDQEDNDNDGGGDNDNNGSCNCVPGEAPYICGKLGSDGVLVAHEHCNKFYKCAHGKNVSMRCYGNLLYNPFKEWCDYPENVKCGDRIIPGPEDDDNEIDQEDNDNDGGGDNDNNGSCNCVPGEAPYICGKPGSDGVLVAHEHCNKFYKCAHGKNVSMRCYGNLLYNPFKEWCDFPENVKCGDRIIPGPEDDDNEIDQEDNDNDGGGDNDNNGSCNCVPGEAPYICGKLGSDGVLVAHEHCNKFYKCAHGKNVSMRCYGNLLYNPFKEWCDFPENVKCGDRIIPGPEDDDNEIDQEDNDNDGGGDNDHNGSCNCVPGEAPYICGKLGSDGVLVAHEHCNKFYKCAHGKNVSMRCNGNLLYNPFKEWCDYPENVKCGDRIILGPEDDDNEIDQEDNDNDGGGDNDNNGSCNCVPGEAPYICGKLGSDGVLVAHEHCNKFYKCAHGKNVSMRCYGNLLYNPFKEWCDYPDNVKCGDRIIPGPEDDDNEIDQEDNDNDGGGDNDNNGSCNCVPGEAPYICGKLGSDGVLVAHEHCNKFYKCAHGKNVSMRCYGNLLYNPFKEWCDYPENVKCGDRIIPGPEDDDNEIDQEDNDNDGGGDNDNNGSCNCVPGEAPYICGKPGSDGVLVAHEHCNKFYKCAHGKNVSMRCYGNLLYNPFKEWCDFPENVKCGDRIIPGPEDDDNEIDQEDNDNDGGGDNDNNGSCNCVPGEAPYICGKLGSDGVLVAHEHCNKFYKCAHGKNVSMRCYGNLLYNPFKEWCDFPENVKCGDRIIPGPEDDDNEIDQEDNDNDGGGDNDNNGSCNCVPGEAPYICGKPGSDGVLVAHEHCNKFYKCAHGKNVSMRCYGNLLYNPFKEWCDYPENVKCGDRIIPGPEDDDNEIDQEDNDNDGGGDNDNNGSCNCVPGEAPYICGKLGSDGVLVAHEHCNKFYKCAHGKNVSMRCYGNLLYNPFKEWCDFPENVKCGDRIIPGPEDDDNEIDQEDNDNDGGGDNDNNGSCNCVPGEAPYICGKPGSDGVLVAHEHCNKFYKCAHGKNVSMRCYGNLLYNPFKEWCDFPENVKCGDRIIPGPEDDDNEIDQEDNDNDGGGDNDHNGSCNCVPGEAPYICGKLGSDGVLVAHEHCNKFYKCAHGKNVSMRCYGNLLYNPFKEWCDYPENVKCGDRIIPGPEDDDNEIDQEDNDNDGGGDNDNNGSCNCVPGEAPYICGKPGSDGVLVAHEHCNKFYKCAHGNPVEFTCASTLLFNPKLQACDWPNAVECGERIY